jgi:hypothetical protein
VRHWNSYAEIVGFLMTVAASVAGCLFVLKGDTRIRWRWRTLEPSAGTVIRCPTCGRYAESVTAESTFMGRPDVNPVLRNPEWCERMYVNMKVGHA